VDLAEILPVGLDCLTRSSFRIGPSEGLGGNTTLVTEAFQGFRNRAHLGVTTPNGTTVAVGEMNMSDMPSPFSKSSGNVGFFNVHVKKVGQECDALGGEAIQKVRRLVETIEEVRFISVEGFVY
jgi:hypothetical protein